MASFSQPGPDSASGHRRNVIALAGMIVLFATAFLAGGVAHAQDDEQPVTEARGTLRATDENDEQIFLEGVELVLTDAETSARGPTQ